MMIRHNTMGRQQPGEATQIFSKANVILRMKTSGIEDTDKEGKAAVFNRSHLEDYNTSRLNELQKSIMDTRDRINEIKEDKTMKSEEKEKMLRPMREHLTNLDKQMAEVMTPKKQEVPKEDKNPKKEPSKDTAINNNAAKGGNPVNAQDKAAQETGQLIAAGSGLERVKTLSQAAQATERKAVATQRELDAYVNHPGSNVRHTGRGSQSQPNPIESSLQLRAPELIAKRQGEINRLVDGAQKLNEAAGEIAHQQITPSSADDITAVREEQNKAAAEETKQSDGVLGDHEKSAGNIVDEEAVRRKKEKLLT